MPHLRRPENHHGGGVLAQLGERQTEEFSDLKVAGSIPVGPTSTHKALDKSKHPFKHMPFQTRKQACSD
jgi:hypothetical protein